jgi:hypothetical protein
MQGVMRDPYRALRFRDFRLLLIGAFLASLGQQMLGVALLASYLRQYGDVRMALAAYNEDSQNLARGIGASTARYIADVLALRASFAQ